MAQDGNFSKKYRFLITKGRNSLTHSWIWLAFDTHHLLNDIDILVKFYLNANQPVLGYVSGRKNNQHLSENCINFSINYG